MLEATIPAFTPTPKTESLRVTSPLAHDGHATFVDAPGTYFSKSFSQPRHRYS